MCILLSHILLIFFIMFIIQPMIEHLRTSEKLFSPIFITSVAVYKVKSGKSENSSVKWHKFGMKLKFFHSPEISI
jgi:hypothetical protein